MNINKKQKIILLVCVVLIIVCWLSPPTEGRGRAETINYLGLLINWIGVLILGGLACLWAKGPESPEDVNTIKKVLKITGMITVASLLVIALVNGGMFAYEKYQEVKANQKRDLAACENVKRKLKNNTHLGFCDLQNTVDNEYCDPEFYGFKKVINNDGSNYFTKTNNTSESTISRVEPEDIQEDAWTNLFLNDSNYCQ